MIPAIRFVSGTAAEPYRAEVTRDDVYWLKTRVVVDGASVLIVRARHLAQFRTLESLVIDRGLKKPLKALADRLLGQARVPLVSGSYRSAGQLVRSVRTLLDRAAKRGDLNIFVIGIDDDVFEAAWTKAQPTPPAPTGDAAALMNLLPPDEIPEELTRKYLGRSLQAQLVRRLIVRAAAQDDPVLIIGETGTGKEVVARSIHDFSPRRVESFVSVNCAAIPADLFESELFGHEPEAFTGAAHRKPGLWRIASRGTLFLDEIGDLRPDHQAKILRSLQENAIRPVGAVAEIAVGARVLAATNRNLPALVATGAFREDLFYRLRSFFIPTLSLRQHPEDIPLLARAFWRAVTRDPHATLGEKLIDALSARQWPGNARELRAVLQNLHALFGKTRVTPEHLKAVTRLQDGLADRGRP